MMWLAWMCRPWPEPGRLLPGERTRFRVRCDRPRPQPEHGIAVRRHVLGMLRRGGDRGILIGGIKTTLRERRVVVRMDQIVEHSGGLRQCLRDPVEGGPGLVPVVLGV